MGETTAIEWAEATWNPISGCTKVSPGCAYCYAERVGRRMGWLGADQTGTFGPQNGGVKLHPERLGLPSRWKKPRRIFVNSMSDLFHEDVPDEFIWEVFGVMAAMNRHLFLVLTKRPERMRALLSLQPPASARGKAWSAASFFRTIRGDESLPWPLLNVWLGVSVENQRWADERIPVLLQAPAAMRFVSCEPLLGPLDLRPWLNRALECGPDHQFSDRWAARGRLHWLICGGESGPGARPMNLDWARSLRDQCQEAGVPFFLKQLGGWPDKRGGEKALLDGRLWHQEP